MSPDPLPIPVATDSASMQGRLVKPWLAKLPQVCAIAGAVLPATGLLGWILNLPQLREVVTGGKPINPMAATALFLASVALTLLATQRNPALRIGRWLGILVMVIGTARVLDFTFGNSLRVDLLLFRDLAARYPGDPQMTPVAAGCFALIGLIIARYGGTASRSIQRYRYLLTPVAMLAFYVVAGSAYGGQVFMSIAQFKPMALNAAISCLFLSAGLAALSPAVPPISTLAMEGSGGSTARRLLPAVLLIPFVLGWLRVIGERAQLFDMGFGTAALTTFTAVLLVLLVLLSVRYLNRTEKAQRQLELGLRHSEQRLFQILEAIPLGLYVLDRTGRPYYSNQRSTEILRSGLAASPSTPEETARRYHVHRAGTGEPYPPDQLPIAHALRGERVYKSDLELYQTDRVVPIEVWSAPVTAADGSVEFAISAFNDITARQESERQIEALNQELSRQVTELAAVNNELETFSYSVSHDLRAPLRAVDGFSRMLAEDHAGVLGPEGLRLLDRIRSNIRRMGLLIDDLLHFSRLSRQELEAAPVDMAGLVRTVVEDMSRTRERPVPVVIGNLPPASGDIDLLRQVWINLIDNGLKYSGKSSQPRVEVGAESNGEEIRYWVRDNGVGFDMAYADKLFGVFQRLHAQDEFEGTGVGLAIVQRVVHRHGGRVWAEGLPQQGATFSFSLPVGG